MSQKQAIQVLLLTLNTQFVFNQHTLICNENYTEEPDMSVTYIYDIFYIKMQFTPMLSLILIFDSCETFLNRKNFARYSILQLNRKIEFIFAILLQ